MLEELEELEFVFEELKIVPEKFRITDNGADIFYDDVSK